MKKQGKQTLMQTNKRREKTSKVPQSEMERDKQQRMLRRSTASLNHTKETCTPHNCET